MSDESRSGSDRETGEFRVAAVYGVVGFGVIEAADVIFPRVPLPEWTAFDARHRFQPGRSSRRWIAGVAHRLSGDSTATRMSFEAARGGR